MTGECSSAQLVGTVLRRPPRWSVVIVASVTIGLVAAQIRAEFASASLNSDCNPPGITEYAPTWTRVTRHMTGPEILGVIGNVEVVTLRPCIDQNTGSTFGLDYDVPWVIPVTLLYRKDPTANAGRAVQIGYGKCGRVTGVNCPSMPNDGKPHFTYTPNDQSGGQVALASWYDGGTGVRKDPILGHEYRFKIESYGTQWRYCIRDYGIGEAYDCTYTSRSWPSASGQWAWWLTETNSRYSQNGNADSEPDIDLRWMQYELGSQENWRVVTDSTVCEKATGDPSTYEYPANYRCSIRSSVYTNDMLWSYTVP